MKPSFIKKNLEEDEIPGIVLEFPIWPVFTVIFVMLKAQKMMLLIEHLFSEYDQICRKLSIWPHLLKKYLMQNIIFSAVTVSMKRISFNDDFFYWFKILFKARFKISPLTLNHSFTNSRFNFETTAKIIVILATIRESKIEGFSKLEKSRTEWLTRKNCLLV